MKVKKIEWIDSCASNILWTLMTELEGEIQPIHIISYGVLLQDNEKTITIAQNYGINPLQACSFMTIPKGCIEEITDIDEFEIEVEEEKDKE